MHLKLREHLAIGGIGEMPVFFEDFHYPGVVSSDLLHVPIPQIQSSRTLSFQSFLRYLILTPVPTKDMGMDVLHSTGQIHELSILIGEEGQWPIE